MDFVINYWYIIVAVIVLVAVAAIIIYRFYKLPTEAQLSKVREWLLWAVTEAEKELGSGTGKLKLRQVYDLFLMRFPWLVKIVSFEIFSELVDEALVEMRELMKQNSAVKSLVNGAAPQKEM